MSYSTTRDAEQLRRMDTSIAAFVQRYTNSSTPAANRRTLILLVGGGGSQLIRAKTKYQAGGGPGQTFSYDTVWIDFGTFVGDAQLLRMHPVAGEQDHDLGDRIVIADGALELFNLTPYSGFTAWCDNQGIDWFVYGWDWRRSLDEMAAFFVGQFLPYFSSEVQLAGLPDPLTDLVLLGHSSGGMVLELALRQTDPALAGLSRAITVCTPFYGYGGQLHRWFEGQPPFNFPTPLDTIKTISSFAGTYALMYLDEATFTANQAAFAADTPYVLLDYPSKDAAAPLLDVDAYNPVGKRYPTGSGFRMSFLTAGAATYAEVAAGPCAAYADVFYNIRGVQTTNATTGGITWALLPAGYVPGGGFAPIQDDAVPVPGDGTQPAWTARLLSLPKTHWITVTGDIEHMFMLNYPQTLTAIGKVLGITAAAMKRRTKPQIPLVEPASSAEALAFARELQRFKVEDAANVEARMTTFVNSLTLGQLKAIARRILIDLAKGPSGKPDAPAPPSDSGGPGTGRRPRRK